MAVIAVILGALLAWQCSETKQAQKDADLQWREAAHFRARWRLVCEAAEQTPQVRQHCTETLPR